MVIFGVVVIFFWVLFRYFNFIVINFVFEFVFLEWIVLFSVDNGIDFCCLLMGFVIGFRIGDFCFWFKFKEFVTIVCGFDIVLFLFLFWKKFKRLCRSFVLFNCCEELVLLVLVFCVIFILVFGFLRVFFFLLFWLFIGEILFVVVEDCLLFKDVVFDCGIMFFILFLELFWLFWLGGLVFEEFKFFVWLVFFVFLFFLWVSLIIIILKKGMFRMFVEIYVK